MARQRKWKPGEVGWMHSSEMYGLPLPKPVQVQIVSVTEGDLHPVKAQTKSGQIFYCRHDEIQSRAAKAERKPAVMPVPEEVRKEAEHMAEKRMEELKAQQLPTFEEVAEGFYSLAEVGRMEQTHARDVVIALAEKALFDRIKNGVVWNARDWEGDKI